MKPLILAVGIVALGVNTSMAQDVTRGTPTPVIETADGDFKTTLRLLTPLIALGVVAILVGSADIPDE